MQDSLSAVVGSLDRRTGTILLVTNTLEAVRLWSYHAYYDAEGLIGGKALLGLLIETTRFLWRYVIRYCHTEMKHYKESDLGQEIRIALARLTGLRSRGLSS